MNNCWKEEIMKETAQMEKDERHLGTRRAKSKERRTDDVIRCGDVFLMKNSDDQEKSGG